MAGSILTSQHPQYAKYTFLSQKELDKLQDRINHPKWSNSDEHIYKKIAGNYSTQQLLDKQVVSAAGFMPQLIVNGEKMITEGDGGWGSAPRSIMAQKEDGTIMFLVIDGRQTHSIGATLKECQDILYEKGAINAMAMDGGSSATLYLGGKVINSPSTLSHEDRYLPNAWVVIANQKQKIQMTIDGEKVDSNTLDKFDANFTSQ
ncbi:hypothetical protein B4080_3723 [Bacillus cereus]|nr:hypothetical protein B4080_3723 [Bacillus cereus]